MPDEQPTQPNIRLTARDLQILEQLLNRKTESLGAIHQQFWNANTSRDTARYRLHQLTRSGFIARHALEHRHADLLPTDQHDSGWVAAYTLTPKGTAALRRRSLAGNTLRGRSIKSALDDTAIPHQLAVNRVADLLGTPIVAEHLIEIQGQRRHRPDATYKSAPDKTGRSTVMLEVDLGHYSRQRILGKLSTFLADPDAKGVLFACPAKERAAWIAQTLRETHGDRIMDRVQALSFHQIREGRLLSPDLRPTIQQHPESGEHDQLPQVA